MPSRGPGARRAERPDILRRTPASTGERQLHHPLTSIDGPLKLRTSRSGDGRGWFRETYNRREAESRGVDVDFVQDNESLSRRRGTIRGLHFQLPPHAQGKLIRVIRGAIVDVAVDLRGESPTFGDHYRERLDSDSGDQIWVPRGFAHGFCSLEPDTTVAYKVTSFYAPDHERTLRWDDPALGIRWPEEADRSTLSTKDATAPALADLEATGELVP